MDIVQALSAQFSLQRWQVENTVKLIDEGNTIPFIARYRKEAHGSLDDQIIRELSERLGYLRNLDKRRQEVRASIGGQDKMSPELEQALENAATLAEIEDIYRPYRPKRRTRASVAKEKGLEPLAMSVFEQNPSVLSVQEMAEAFVNPEKGVQTIQEAINGAMDIIAENISDNADIRRRLRELFASEGILHCTASDAQTDSVYSKYYDYSEPVAKIAGHRVLAIDRGERQQFLKVKVSVDQIKAMDIINARVLKKRACACTDTVADAAGDAYERLIFPSVERELRAELTDKAVSEALKTFYINLRELLLQPPVKGRRVLGLDPGYRTGCKVAAVDETGKVLDVGVIYITHSEEQKEKARRTVNRMIEKCGIEIISIGNGTASKETEIFVAELLRDIPQKISYMVVNEAGASVYSASKLAAQEFAQFDVSIRSAVSIARRLQDPLAEFVKIDPKSIGVGQYQHDMPKRELEETLDGAVEYCVNAVGVDLNTASPSLLARVSGVNSAVARNIVTYREENGAFSSRAQLKKVPKLGAKAFEQCAGFIRVPESKNVLDNTGVHPESYGIAQALLELCGYTLSDVASGSIGSLPAAVELLGGEEKAAQKLNTGAPTLRDIIKELLKPGRDPRDELPAPLLRTDVMDIKDLTEGMELKGTVRNVIDFGAFIDIGVHQDGLVHISQITDRYIKHPSDVLKVGDIVTVRVLSTDLKKNRISLTMKKNNIIKVKE